MQDKARDWETSCIYRHAQNLVHDGQVKSFSQSIRFRTVSLGRLMTDYLLAKKS